MTIYYNGHELTLHPNDLYILEYHDIPFYEDFF